MRLPDAQMAETDFRDALTEAMRGVTVTDMGAGDDLAAALYSIAEAAPNVPQDLVTIARAAFDAQRDAS